MLHAVAGSKLFIGGPAGQPPLWLEVKELEALGQVGIEWRTIEVELVDEDETGWTETDKVARASQPMQIVFGLDGNDPGQTALWAAAASADWFQFRLVLSDGGARIWSGPVVSCVEILDEANNVLKGQAALAINTAIERPAP